VARESRQPWGRASSGLVASLAPSMTFTRHRAGLRGLPHSSLSYTRCIERLTSLLRLHLSSGALSPRWVSTLLSWDSSASRPCCRLTRWRSTPGDRGPLRPDAATRRISFRPRGFAPPRRLAPSRCRGLVASHCQPGVRRVSDPPRQGDQDRLVDARLPPGASYPSKNSPHQQPYRVTAASALLPLCRPTPSRPGNRSPPEGG
jgi:hypothetical protein